MVDSHLIRILILACVLFGEFSILLYLLVDALSFLLGLVLVQRFTLLAHLASDGVAAVEEQLVAFRLRFLHHPLAVEGAGLLGKLADIVLAPLLKLFLIGLQAANQFNRIRQGARRRRGRS